MLFYHRKNKGITQQTKKIFAVYGECILVESTVFKWFTKFSAGDFNLKNPECTGKLFITDHDQIMIQKYVY